MDNIDRKVEETIIKPETNNGILPTPQPTVEQPKSNKPTISLDDIDETELKEYFIEFNDFDDCRFGSRCIHEKEPSCAVKEAVENGEISKKRYDSYIQLLNEIRQGKRRY